MRELIVGTRGSALARVQTELVCRALRDAHPGLALRVETITTTGDARPGVPLSQLGRGVFVTEIETALRERRIDLAVHSAKDLPSVLTPDLAIAAWLPREDPRDVIVSPFGGLRSLPSGARVGTSSPRRACLLRALRSDIEPVEIRGNVDTRLRKLRSGEYDALMLAGAGLLRLGLADEASEWLGQEIVIPAVGQGVLAVETRADDPATTALVSVLDHSATRSAVTAERAFLAELGAGCRAAAGAYARADADGELRMVAFIGRSDGRHVRGRRGGESNPDALGRTMALDLLRSGGAAFLGRDDSALRGKRVAVTRPSRQSVELLALLRANGAHPLACPTIDIDASATAPAIDAAIGTLGEFDWIVFTSANAVHALADRLEAQGGSLPARVRLAAVGDATAQTAATRLGGTCFVPSHATAESLAAELPVRAEQRVLWPAGNLARDAMASGLARRGARVTPLQAYHTGPSFLAPKLADLVRSHGVDAIVFMSPSSVHFANGAAEALARLGDRAPVSVCIGPTTAHAARVAGIPRVVEAPARGVGGIVDALEATFAP